MVSKDKLPVHRLGQKPSIIAIMGCTGVGKSTFIKTAGAVAIDENGESGGVPVVSDGLEGCTMEPKLFVIPGTNIVLIDTPGFNDTYVSDREMLRRISNVLASLHADKTDIAGILYLHPINDARVTGSSKKNLDMFKKVVGTSNMDHCILVTTKWSCEESSKAVSHEKELANNSNFWRPMFDAGVQYARFEDTRQSALSVISPLCKGNSLVPKVVAEWVYEGKRLHETDAGRAVEDEVERAKKTAQQDIQDIRREKEEALRLKDFENAKALETERKELEARLLKMENEREKLRVQYEEQRRQEQARWEDQRKMAEAQRKREIEEYHKKQKEALEQHEKKIQREAEARFQAQRARDAQMRDNRVGRWAGRIALGILGTGAVVITGGLAAPVVGAVALGHEAHCQEQKESE